MKKKHEEKENSERWLLTYSDLITLLMILFVVMYASSNIDTTKYKVMSQSLGNAMGGGKNMIAVGENSLDTTMSKLPNTTSIQSINDVLSNAAASMAPAAASITGANSSANSALNANSNTGANANNIANEQNAIKVENNKLLGIKTQVDNYLKANGLKSVVNTEITEKGLEISFPDTALFDSGKADIKVVALSNIIEIGKIVNQLGNYIRIEGHTDNVPIQTAQFASNWQLSAIRATNVTELLINSVKINPEKISAVGYGEFRPKASNSTESGKAKNRRVNIVVINTKFNASEIDKPK